MREIDDKDKLESGIFIYRLQKGIWLLGICGWIFGLCDRTTAALADGYLSALDMVLLFTASFFFVCWLFLKPSRSSVTS